MSFDRVFKEGKPNNCFKQFLESINIATSLCSYFQLKGATPIQSRVVPIE